MTGPMDLFVKRSLGTIHELTTLVAQVLISTPYTSINQHVSVPITPNFIHFGFRKSNEKDNVRILAYNF